MRRQGYGRGSHPPFRWRSSALFAKPADREGHSAARDLWCRLERCPKQAVRRCRTLRDLNVSNRCLHSALHRHATGTKREIVALQWPVLRRPFIISDRAENIGKRIGNPMVIAAPHHCTGGAADDTGGDRPPRSRALCADHGEAPIWIMLIGVAETGPRDRAAGAVPGGFSHVFTAPAQVSAARNRPGVTPISRRKMEVRWLWSAKPASCAIWARGSWVRRIKVLARSSRRWMT